MRDKLQGIAFAVVLSPALLADGLMDTLGPVGFILGAELSVAIAGALIWLSGRLKNKESRSQSCDLRERQDQPKRLTKRHPHYEGAERICQVWTLY
ncbi:MAG: hypothetical protein VB096_05920 [Pseudoflavonifractor sp.]|nr:hypothetical protein [Pseudoflavonifractor sp.]